MRRILVTFSLVLLALPLGCAQDTTLTQRALAQKETKMERRVELKKSVPAGTEETMSADSAKRDRILGKKRPSTPKSAPSIAPQNVPARKTAGTRSQVASGGASLPRTLGSVGLGAKVATKSRSRRALSPPPPSVRLPNPAPVSDRKPFEEREKDVDKVSKNEKFVHAGTNPFTDTLEDKFSTFAIDVDTGSYFLGRRSLKVGNKPNPSSVRVEEWVNAFHYDYRQPDGDVPFAVDMEAGPSPFHRERHLVRIGVQGKSMTNEERKPVHLTFLVDVSGSMGRKIEMVRASMSALVNNLRDDDSIAIVTYAGRTEVVLEATKASNKSKLHNAIKNLRTGGGTNMGSGMELAYRNANKFLGDGRNARVIVMSDGDANIGRVRHGSILDSVRGYVSEGVTLSTVGYGNGNYNDHLMEQLANAGNGNYSYIDGPEAIEKIFGEDLVGTLEVIAKDVKIQVEFNPDVVTQYRLVGYENRDIADKDFRNDKVDAGEIGAGHSVTALYEVMLKNTGSNADLATVRVRYKKPRGTKACEVVYAFTRSLVKDDFDSLTTSTRFATSLAVASEILRGSEYAAGLTLDDARTLAAAATAGKFAKERRGFVSLLSHNRLRASR